MIVLKIILIPGLYIMLLGAGLSWLASVLAVCAMAMDRQSWAQHKHEYLIMLAHGVLCFLLVVASALAIQALQGASA